MKKIAILLFLIVVATSLLSCNQSGVTREEYEKVVSERDELKLQVNDLQGKISESASVSTEDNVNTIINKKIVFESENTANFTIYEQEGITKGGVTCVFDGSNLGKEILRVTTFVYVMKQMDISNFLIAVSSGDDIGCYSYQDGELSPISTVVPTYVGLKTNFTEEDLREELKFIGEQLGENLDNVASVDKTENSLIFVHEDEFVKVEYLRCEKGRMGDEIIFYVTNKTDVELTFQCDSFALDGENISSITGSDGIAAQSKGKIHYTSYEGLPTLAPDKITGTIRVVDFSETLQFDTGRQSYNIKFVNLEV